MLTFSPIKNILQKIHSLAKKIKRPVRLMEVCGTHTQTVVKYGIRQLMPFNIKLTTGPGCPVCITPQSDIDGIISLALAGIPIASYGDVLRVPGSAFKTKKRDYYLSLEKARELGAEVMAVYSVAEAMQWQKEKPNLVFFGLGFETTAPMTAWAVKQGLTVYSAHRLFFPALSSLLKIKELKIDGFICPGHVSTIIGSRPYKQIQAPQVIAGFEPEDVLISIYLLLKQIAENRAEVENEYSRSVTTDGNQRALKLMFEIFEIQDGDWRGLGRIAESGLEIKKQYSAFDAKVKYRNILNNRNSANPNLVSSFLAKEKNQNGQFARLAKICQCAKIILGLAEPHNCPLFKKVCSPDTPYGPCMVSNEGACGIAARYG